MSPPTACPLVTPVVLVGWLRAHVDVVSRQADYEELTKLQLIETSINGLLPLSWVPVVDGQFLPGEPWEMLEKGEFNQVPTIIGYNKVGGGIFICEKVYSRIFAFMDIWRRRKSRRRKRKRERRRQLMMIGGGKVWLSLHEVFFCFRMKVSLSPGRCTRTSPPWMTSMSTWKRTY